MKKAKLGMTVQPPRRNPYDKLDEQVGKGVREQRNLEQAGSAYERRLQQRLPKVQPAAKPRGGRA